MLFHQYPPDLHAYTLKISYTRYLVVLFSRMLIPLNTISHLPIGVTCVTEHLMSKRPPNELESRLHQAALSTSKNVLVFIYDY